MNSRMKLAALGLVLVVGISFGGGGAGGAGEAGTAFSTEGARQIDGGLFPTQGSPVRSFTKEVVIRAPAEAVYAAWTDEAAWSRVYDPPSKANIELVIGGRYEWLFDGTIGSNGCQVLSYVPNRMLSFSWNAPPDQPESRALRTWVVVETERQDAGTTLVRVTHLGFGDGENWDETYAYFEAAWDRVLARFRDSLESDSAS